MILAKSIRNIDQKGAIGNHEFTLKPRSLFPPDGSMLRCPDKSKLIRLLEMLGKEAKLEQGRLPSEDTGCVYECSMDEDVTDYKMVTTKRINQSILIPTAKTVVIATKIEFLYCLACDILSKQLLDGVHFAIKDGGPKSFYNSAKNMNENT